MRDFLYIRQKSMRCSLATLQMVANRFDISPVEASRLFAAHGTGLSVYSPGDICLLFRRMGMKASLIESPKFEEIADRPPPFVLISFLVPTGHHLLVEKILPDKKLLVSDPLGCFPYGRNTKDGHNCIYDYKTAIAFHIAMPYWLIYFNVDDTNIEQLDCGYTVADIAFKNKSAIIKNGYYDYLSREVNTILNLNHWQGWKLESIRGLSQLCESHKVKFNNQVTDGIANVIIKTFVSKWRRLNSMQVK